MDRDLEEDFRNNPVLMEKIKEDRYAQNVYAAWCNMRWQPQEVWPVLKDEYWTVSWRSSGGIVAELQGQGDYLSWYCSGIRSPDEHIETGFVSEGVVTEEIATDLATLGWHPVPWGDNDI